MAIKTFCDVCSNEINGNEMTGSFVFLDRDWNKAIKQGKEHSIVRKEMIFCEPCATKVKTTIAQFQLDCEEELEKNN